jgi:hypothetical protein
LKRNPINIAHRKVGNSTCKRDSEEVTKPKKEVGVSSSWENIENFRHTPKLNFDDFLSHNSLNANGLALEGFST